MKNSSDKALAIAKINFRQSKLTYIITVVVFLLVCLDATLDSYIFKTKGGEIGVGQVWYLGIILAAIFIPALNFNKIMHLNGKKIDFFWGSLLNLIVFSAVIPILNLIIYYTFDKSCSTYHTVWNLVDIFGWSKNGIVLAYFQQFAFLLLAGVFIHTLTAAQSYWVGWLIDIVLVVIISVFTPIEPLRAILSWFFNLIIFNSNAFIQIISCLGISAVIYAAYLLVLRSIKIQ